MDLSSIYSKVIYGVLDALVSIHPYDVLVALVMAVLVVFVTKPKLRAYLCGYLNLYMLVFILVTILVCVDVYSPYFRYFF